jgi:signal transduction histidine kinase/DNA-binding response OmpR family regulator
MDETPPDRSIPFNLDLVLRKGVGRNLLVCFIGLSMIPLALAGWMGYRTSRNHLEKDLVEGLRVSIELKSLQLEDFFEKRLDAAADYGRQPDTITLFNALARRYRASGQALDVFVRSAEWKTAVSAYGSGVRLHAGIHGYSDILITDPDRKVLFSVAGSDALGHNLDSTHLATADLSAACNKTLETGQPAFGGFATALTADNALSLFFTAAIGSTDGDPRGVIVYQLPGSAIQEILDSSPEPANGIRAYLIDTDLTLLAGMIGRQPDGSLKTDAEIARRWRKRLHEGTPAPSLPISTIGLDGQPVTGTYATIRVNTIPLALIMEIDRTAVLAAAHRLRTTILTIIVLTGAGVFVVSLVLAHMIVGPVRDLTHHVQQAVRGHLDINMKDGTDTDMNRLVMACGNLADHLKAVKTDHETHLQLMEGLINLYRLIGGNREKGELCLNTLEFLADFLDLNQADFFIQGKNGRFRCACHFPGQPACEFDTSFSPGEGRIGQAAMKKAIATFRKDATDGQVIDVPSADLANLVTVPLVLRETVMGVLELEKLGTFTPFDSRYLEAGAEVIAMVLNMAMISEKEADQLTRTRERANQLKTREAALEDSTRKLKEQRLACQLSEQELQLKQLELEAANAQMVKNASDLETNMATLEKQKKDMQRKNDELARTHRKLAEKARQLEISSRYKTEFMANMSHELRTPLNSILLLTRLLLENKEKTLTTRQFDFAQTIQSAGEDLLNLINEILDLAKVESGKMGIDVESVAVRSIGEAMLKSFAPLAEQSGVAFSIHVAPDAPERLNTDRKRVDQIVKNFLSNAFKFTSRGSIRLEIAVSGQPLVADEAPEKKAKYLAISVVDTGIGIPPDKHEMVFEAFQQVDGSTRRKYGGTGLGLSISRELARLLGGEITLESQEGQGSRFTLHLPMERQPEKTSPIVRKAPETSPSIDAETSRQAETEGDRQYEPESAPDDRNRLMPGDKCVLIVVADPATIDPIKIIAHQNGFKVLVAGKIHSGLYLADYYVPTAVFADRHLTGTENWAFVHRIKANPKCRHVPVYSLSTRGDDFVAAVHGAAGHVGLPPTPGHLEAMFQQIDDWRSSSSRTVLIVDPNHEMAARIGNAVGKNPIHLTRTPTAATAQAVFDRQQTHAVILNPALDTAELNLFLTAMQKKSTPVLVYSGASLNTRSMAAIDPFRGSVNLTPIETEDQLLSVLVAALHLSPDSLDESHRQRLLDMERKQSPMKGRTVLLADDDMRTVFAVTSALEDQGMEVYTGKTGKESLDKLDRFPDIDLILMDVMIAGTDGYQAIKSIRRRSRYNSIPILVLTAKAMRGDRAKCIDAGADDYLAKPVNLDKLISMLKIWLDAQAVTPERITD